MKPKGKVKIKWSSDFAYAIGLIASDGSLSNNRRHIVFTTKDLELAKHFKSCLELDNKIGRKARGSEKEKKYYVVQFGDVLFCEFLNSIGLYSNKAKSIQCVEVPEEFFVDFFRGYFDGDGSIVRFIHPESRRIQLRLTIASASVSFLKWMKSKLVELYKIDAGYIQSYGSNRVAVLAFGKRDALQISKLMYHPRAKYYLKRKKVKFKI